MLFKPILHMGFKKVVIGQEYNHSTWLKTNHVISFGHFLLQYTDAKGLYRPLYRPAILLTHRRGCVQFNKNHVLQSKQDLTLMLQIVCMLLKGSIQSDSCWDVYSHIFNLSLAWTNCSCFNISLDIVFHHFNSLA